ncbi:MAG: hypothetical protein U9Q35_00975 [Pseudomonadota bacterium]|nr:hypothetical protein [Pseudomonadota bacterium]
MATLTVQKSSIDGIAPTYAAADIAGDEFAWGRSAFLHVKNGDAASHTVTIASQVTARPGIAPADIAVAVPAGEERIIGPFTEGAFKDGNGSVQVGYDAVASVTVAAISV